MSVLSPETTKFGVDKYNDTLPHLSAFLDADPHALFIVPIDLKEPLPFTIAFGNKTYHGADYESAILANCSAALRFRSWCQTTRYWTEEHVFADHTWTAFTIQDKWKCIQGRIENLVKDIEDEPEISFRTDSPATLMVGQNSTNNENNKIADPIADVKLASLYKMMEMSDVGTFEYSPSGKLLRANDSWYRMSLHPKGDDVKPNFSFMDLVFPADIPLVLSMWNKLTQGLPVTFEMRWKGRDFANKSPEDYNDDDDDDDATATWMLSACVPIMDNAHRLVSICGNTIDIGAQKRAQKDAMQRAKALQRARASEHRFERFALMAPVGIFILTPERKFSYCNSKFFELLGHPKAENTLNIDWESLVHLEDQPAVDQDWETVTVKKKRGCVQFRLRKSSDLGDGILRQSWAETQAVPELDSRDNVVSVFGILTDISRSKWAEEQQRIRMESALDAKRKAENFIDMTSHEMRNPLSAVLQCADSTVDSLNSVCRMIAAYTVSREDHNVDRINEEIKVCLDSLNTIISCSMHQKRVVDDILTLSKMDSNLIVITPMRLDPTLVVSEALHMFEVECARDDIELKFTQHSSLRDLDIDYVMMDPSRLLQVLINLLTNAIKFTRNRPVRQIEVILGVSALRPTERCPDLREINFTAIESDSDGLLEKEGWGSGPISWLWIMCRDTGCGLSPAEQSRLFTRFSQATPKTHIQYGGSGLGLFISKKLAELQAGAIGVQSASDIGSTFAFYVGVRKARPPSPDFTRRLSMATGASSPATTRITSVSKDRPRYTILVVEDNLINQKVLSQQLTKAGCEVHVANHGQEALEFLRKTKYWCQRLPSTDSPILHDQESVIASNEFSDQSPGQAIRSGSPVALSIDLSVVLMDIEMPIMDGLTCALKIREYQSTGEIQGHVPIMAVSANARSEQVAQAKDVGMDDTIAKPFRISELLPKIEALVLQHSTLPNGVLDGIRSHG